MGTVVRDAPIVVDWVIRSLIVPRLTKMRGSLLAAGTMHWQQVTTEETGKYFSLAFIRLVSIFIKKRAHTHRHNRHRHTHTHIICTKARCKLANLYSFYKNVT